MACVRPMPAAWGGDGHKPVFLPRSQADKANLELPCGFCVGCRIDQASDWAARCTHEAQLHKHKDGTPNTAFITLTFSDAGLEDREKNDKNHPNVHTIQKRDWQLFAKRLREKLGPFRFLMTGEYGDERLRPHYHALLFGQDFREDRVTCVDARTGRTFYRSANLAELWPRGDARIQEMVPETINYVCRYVTKKLRKRDSAPQLYERVDGLTGEVFSVSKEFGLMSRNPGIGADWYKKYRGDVFPSDFTVIQGRKHRVPRFYLNKYQIEEPEEAERIKTKRQAAAEARAADNTPERREVLKEILERKRNKALGTL